MDNRGHFLSRLGLQRPISAVMILLAVLAIGYIAYSRIPGKMMPEGYNIPFLYVFLPYSNASPREIEEQIVKPVEEILGTVNNIKRINSRSNQRGAGIFVEFEEETDMSLAYNQVVDRLDRVRPELPEDQRYRYVRKWDPNSQPVMWVALALKDGYEVDDPYDLMERFIQRPLERVDGVAKVEIWGAREKSIYVKIKQDRIQSYHVNMYQLWQTLQQANFTLSGGYVTEGDRKMIVSSVAKFKSLDQIRNLVIRGTNIRVKDVADVEYDFEERTRINRINRREGMAITIFHEEQANPIELDSKLRATVNKAFKDHPQLEPFDHYILFSQGQIMQDTLDEFKMTALYGGIFAFFILFFFLRKVKMTLIITIALPLSLTVMLIIIYFIGWSLNMATMMGLILSVGMVVDNSIVVAENIFRIRQQGYSRRKAALKGASEVGIAITMSTLTTIVIFLPLMIFSGGILSFMMTRIGVPVILAILASLFIALYFIPLGTAVFHEPEKTSTFFLARWFDKIYRVTVEALNKFYTRFLKIIIAHRVEFLIIILAIFATIFIIIDKIPKSDEMEGNINDLRMILSMPDNSTLEDSDMIAEDIEKKVWEKKEEYDVKAMRTYVRARRVHIRVFLNPPPKRYLLGKFINWVGGLFDGEEKKMTREQVIADLKKRIPQYPGVRLRWSWSDRGGTGDTSIAVNIFGKDLKQLEIYTEEAKRRLRTIPGIMSVETDYEEEGKDEIQLKIDRRMARNLGINPSAIAGTVAYSLRGNLLTRFQLSDREVDVYLQLREEDRKTLEQLKNLTVTSQTGQSYPLSTVVQPVVERGPSELRRIDRRSMLGVTVTTTRKDLNKLYSEIRRKMSNMDLRRGYEWDFGSRFRRFMEIESNIFIILLLEIVFIFFLMGILFESFILPFSVIMAIPFGFWGSVWILYITGTPLNMMAYIGIAILVGVVVNNAIVLVDLINRLRKQGLSRSEAIIEGGRQRFRPIIMTALTTIFGLLPMTIGGASTAGMSYAPLGRAFTGGLIASTVSTLFLVPIIYTYLDDLREKVGKGILSSIINKGKVRNT